MPIMERVAGSGTLDVSTLLRKLEMDAFGPFCAMSFMMYIVDWAAKLPLVVGGLVKLAN